MNNLMVSARSKTAFLLFIACVILCPQYSVSGESEARNISSEFRVKLFDETSITFEHLRGKVTVIDFWGTWCMPCLAEIPDFRSFYEDYKDKGVIFMALAVDSGKAEKVKEASKRLKIDYPVGVPSKEELKTIGKIRNFPTTWIIGPSGEIVREFQGVVPDKHEMIRETVDSLLTEKAILPYFAKSTEDVTNKESMQP